MLKRKLEELEMQESLYGDGRRWCRGPMIGKGNFGSVFLATLKKPKWRLTNHKQVMAVKSAEISDCASLQKERIVLDNLQGCPYILECFGEEITTGKNGEMVYNLLLEYGSGGNLAERIKKSNGKGLLEEEVRFYTRCMLLGLDHIHALGYIHRDLKPENVILVPTHNASDSMQHMAKIGDYGSVKDVRRIRKMKIEPYLRGNIKYLSPELVVDNKQGPESDIWAIGCIVFEMLTGKSLWEEMKDTEIEDTLFRIGMGHGALIIKVPDQVSKMAREFLIACLGCKTMRRWAAEMLLNHPFIVGV